MKAYRDDVRSHMVRHGRNPDDCKVLFMVAPIIGETEADAQERKRLRQARAAAQIPQRLAFLGKLMNIDFGRMDLDRPIPATSPPTATSKPSTNSRRWPPAARCARRWASTTSLLFQSN